jgi:hypothetical protein
MENTTNNNGIIIEVHAKNGKTFCQRAKFKKPVELTELRKVFEQYMGELSSFLVHFMDNEGNCKTTLSF